jgi:hypothetical protein
LPSSTSKHLTERFKVSPDGKSLIYSGVIEDPVYLAKPVEWTGQWMYRPNMQHSNEKCDLEVARKFLKRLSAQPALLQSRRAGKLPSLGLAINTTWLTSSPRSGDRA